MSNELTPERMAVVMRPKALGAWHLHQYTESLNLDYFESFSSISAIVGKPGQGNYVAANAYLDQLAHYRQAKGLAAQSLNWGVLADVGMVARHGDVLIGRLAQMGIDSFTPDEAMQMLAVALKASNAQLGLMNMDWQVFWQTSKARINALRYGHLFKEEWLVSESPVQKFYLALTELDKQQRLVYLTDLLVEWISRIMRVPAANMDRDMPLTNFGLDSLMAVEIQGLIEKETGVSLSVLQILQGNSIEQLAEALLARLEIQI